MSKHWTDDLKHNKPQYLDEKDFHKENPEVTYRKQFAKAIDENPLDIKNYQNIGKVEHHTSESVIEKMIQKREAVTGQKIKQAAAKPTDNLSMSGINDNRDARKFFKIYTKG